MIRYCHGTVIIGGRLFCQSPRYVGDVVVVLLDAFLLFQSKDCIQILSQEFIYFLSSNLKAKSRRLYDMAK